MRFSHSLVRLLVRIARFIPYVHFSCLSSSLFRQRSPIFWTMQLQLQLQLKLETQANVHRLYYHRILIKHFTRNLSHYNQLWYAWSRSPIFFFFNSFIFITYFYHNSTLTSSMHTMHNHNLRLLCRRCHFIDAIFVVVAFCFFQLLHK